MGTYENIPVPSHLHNLSSPKRTLPHWRHGPFRGAVRSLCQLQVPPDQLTPQNILSPMSWQGCWRGVEGALPYLTSRLCVTVWAGSWNVFGGSPAPPPHIPPPPEERKIIFRIVNFKHEKAVFNLAETGLNLHFVNICVLQRKAEHACAHRQAYTQIHTCPCSGIPAYMCLLIYS